MAFSLCTKLHSVLNHGIASKIRLTSIVPLVNGRLLSLQSKTARFLNPTKTNITIIRPFFFKLFSKPSPEKLKVVDNIPDYYRLIYRNTMHRYVLLAQVSSSVSAIIVGIVALIYNTEEMYHLDPQQWRTDELPKPIENEALIYIISFIGLCVILQSMVFKMPIRIYNLPQKEKYIFVFYGTLPMTKRRLICKVRDVVKLEESGVLPWKDSRYAIQNKQKIIMMENFFRRPADLNIMLGYQKQPENYD